MSEASFQESFLITGPIRIQDVDLIAAVLQIENLTVTEMNCNNTWLHGIAAVIMSCAVLIWQLCLQSLQMWNLHFQPRTELSRLQSMQRYHVPWTLLSWRPL